MGERVSGRTLDRLPDEAAAKALLADVFEQEFVFAPVDTVVPIGLYGGGRFGEMAVDYLQYVGLKPDFLLDREGAAPGSSEMFGALPIFKPQEVPDRFRERDSQIGICVATHPYLPIEESLARRGFDQCFPFYDLCEGFRDANPLANGWVAGDEIRRSLDQTESVISMWADDLSRASYLQFLAWHMCRQEWRFEGQQVDNHNRFFIPEVTDCLAQSERFLDIGAHWGNVTTQFHEIAPKPIAAVHAIEPDLLNNAKLAERLPASLEGVERVTHSNVVVASQHGEVRFHDGLGFYSQIAASGKSRRAATTIDAIDFSPSFIKLHIEGGELEALQGAQATLRDHRPIVAMTIYHDEQGILAAPAWIREELENYRFYLRNHSWMGTGTVLYAVPEER